jgi:hypothetical protein
MKRTLFENLAELVGQREQVPASELWALIDAHKYGNRCGAQSGDYWDCDAPKGHEGEHLHDFDDVIEWGDDD